MRPIEAPPSLAQSVADQIREEILSGRLPSGQRLVEAKIAGTLDVSRGPVREAFKLLCAEGLLEEEPRRGMYVVSLTPDDIREIYDLRSAIEGRAAQLLAASHRDADLKEMRKRLEQLDAAADKGDIRAFSRADLEFYPNWFAPTWRGRLRERTFVAAPITYSAYRFTRSLFSDKGYAH